MCTCQTWCLDNVHKRSAERRAKLQQLNLHTNRTMKFAIHRSASIGSAHACCSCREMLFSISTPKMQNGSRVHHDCRLCSDHDANQPV